MVPEIISDFSNLTLPDSIAVVLLDLDNTCYEYEPCHRAGLAKLAARIQELVGPLPQFTTLYSEAQKRVKKRIPDHAASHSRILYILSLFELLGRNDGHIHASELEDTYWNEFMSKMEITEGLKSFLAGCKKSGKKVVVVSDLTTTIQCKKMTHLGISTYIDFLVTAEEAGADKPDPRPFLLALEKVQVKAAEAVVIGDSQAKDIAGATSLNITSILFTHAVAIEKTSVR